MGSGSLETNMAFNKRVTFRNCVVRLKDLTGPDQRRVPSCWQNVSHFFPTCFRAAFWRSNGSGFDILGVNALWAGTSGHGGFRCATADGFERPKQMEFCSGASAECRILPAAAYRRRRVTGCLPTAAARFDFWLFFRFLNS